MNLAEIRKKAGKSPEAVSANHPQPLSFTEMQSSVSRESQAAEPSIEPSNTEVAVSPSPGLPDLPSRVEAYQEQIVVQVQPERNEPIIAAALPVEPPAVSQDKNAAVPPVAAPDYDPLAVLLAGRESVFGDSEDSFPTLDDENDVAGEEMAEYLCFRVSDEQYAVNIMEIKEIIKPRDTTEVPRAPGYVAGVLSLRGVIIPIFDMRKRLGLAGSVATGKERIVVVKKEEGFCGILVDEVVQVARIPLSSIEAAPTVLDGIDRDFVSGIGRYEGTMIILLSMEHILDLTLA